MKTTVIIFRGPRANRAGWMAGDLKHLNPHVTKVFVYALNYFSGDIMTPARIPTTENITNIRLMTAQEKILYKVENI